MTRIIGIAGTAKNTGKTTTMTAIMAEAYQREITLGLTSIGYDGELVDNVTGLPKPRVQVEKGTLVAIAQKCLVVSSASVKIMEETGIRTALGRLIIGVVEEPGLVVIAGPNKSSELRWVNQRLAELGSSLILVDGALNRIAPMVETQGLIIATGASRTTDLEKLGAETRAIASILNLPGRVPGEKADLHISSLLNQTMVQEFLRKLGPEIKTVQVSGIIGENSWKLLAEDGLAALKGKTLVMTDPIKVLVSGAPDSLLEILTVFKGNSTGITVAKSVNLLAITMNPFYPKYRYISHDYEPAYVDKDELRQHLTRGIELPVIDIMEDGVESLWPVIGL